MIRPSLQSSLPRLGLICCLLFIARAAKSKGSPSCWDLNRKRWEKREKRKELSVNIDVQQLIFHLIDIGHTDMILFGKLKKIGLFQLITTTIAVSTFYFANKNFEKYSQAIIKRRQNKHIEINV